MWKEELRQREGLGDGGEGRRREGETGRRTSAQRAWWVHRSTKGQSVSKRWRGSCSNTLSGLEG